MNNTAYTYSAQLSDGVTFTGIGFRVDVSGTGAPEAAVDAAAAAFFQEINSSWLPVTSATKSTEASESDSFNWSGA